MWRNVAKQATLKSQSKSLNFPPSPRTHSFLGASKEPIFFGKLKFHSLNNTSPRLGFRAIGEISTHEDFMGKPRFVFLRNSDGTNGNRWRRQVKIEAEAWELATKEYKELLKDMCEHKLAPNLPYMKSLFLGWFEPFADAIAKEQELIRTGKSRQAYAPYFDLLPADKMSVIAMHQLAAIVMTGGEHGCARVVTAACMIGDAIEQEFQGGHSMEIRIHNILEKTRKKKEKADDSKNGVEGESLSVMKEQENLRKKVTDLIKKQKLPAVRKIVKGKDDSKPWNDCLDL
ncbi:DNA-DIRECTED RNA polymerase MITOCHONDRIAL [Salix viminalis]|uniref:DNA-DIRECTED RNA polymerase MITOCHONDRIAL n=1 Tax=Salix viminalis TaxID=40686 RepID=A0A9Q0SPE6_SALVM|nr:DNA-DIRECTED RNA polymerase MITOCHONDRIAL [Salix viminalis]